MDKIRAQFINVTNIFECNELTMMSNEAIGEGIYALYSDVPDYHYLFDRVKTDMVANKKVIEKNRKI